MNSSLLKRCGSLEPAEPLYKRVPTRNTEGRLLNDLMMIIPGLKIKPVSMQQAILNEIEKALRLYQQYVVFAELNLKLGTLWLSLQPVPGLGGELAALIHHLVPEARLVAQHHE